LVGADRSDVPGDTFAIGVLLLAAFILAALRLGWVLTQHLPIEADAALAIVTLLAVPALLVEPAGRIVRSGLARARRGRGARTGTLVERQRGGPAP
jgi:hypothetical protein